METDCDVSEESQIKNALLFLLCWGFHIFLIVYNLDWETLCFSSSSWLTLRMDVVARRPETKGKNRKFILRFIGHYQVYRQVSPVSYSVDDLPCNRKKWLWRHFNSNLSQMLRFSVWRETDWCPEKMFSTTRATILTLKPQCYSKNHTIN